MQNINFYIPATKANDVFHASPLSMGIGSK